MPGCVSIVLHFLKFFILTSFHFLMMSKSTSVAGPGLNPRSTSPPPSSPLSSSARHRGTPPADGSQYSGRSQESELASEIADNAHALLDGASFESVDSYRYRAIIRYLRTYKATLLKKRPPDYPQAQRIDDLCSELVLLTNQVTFCDYKNVQKDRLEQKLVEARQNLQRVLDERAHCEEIFNERRQRALAKLGRHQQRELDAHDQLYTRELPVKYRHLSGEVLQIREQERYLRASKRYLEAQQLMEEADAVEAFELERQRVRWINEGVGLREEILAKHEKQLICLNAKLNLEWQSMLPGSIARENHCRAVIQHLEDQMNKDQVDADEALSTTRGMLKTEPGLPSLGRKVPQSPARHVTNVNLRREYTQKGLRMIQQSRAHSSLH
jgi:hypothetical protein